MKGEKMKVKEFLKENVAPFVIILIFGLITYGIKLVTYTYSIDTESFLFNRTDLLNSWLTVSRYGLVFLKHIIDFANINLYLANFMGFLFLFLSIIVCIYNVSLLTNHKDKRIHALLGGLIITSPIIVEQFNFTLQCAEVAFAVLLVNLAFTIINRCLLHKDKYFLLILPVIFLVIAFACYQSTVVLMIALSAFFAMLFFKEKDEKGLRVILHYIVLFVVSFLVYKIIDKMVMKVNHITSASYLSDQILWGKDSFGKVVMQVIRNIIDIVLARGMYHNLGLLICVVEFIYLICYQFQRKNWVLYISMMTFLMATFGLNIVLGGATAIRTQLPLPFIVALAVYFLFINTEHEVQKRIYMIVFGMIIFVQAVTSFELFYSDAQVFKQQKLFAIDIQHDIKEKNIDASKTIVVIGNFSAGGPDIIRKGETMGSTFFEWDATSEISSNFRIRNFFATLGFPRYELISKEQFEEAKIISREMPNYPQEGYIREEADYTIVKLNSI